MKKGNDVAIIGGKGRQAVQVRYYEAKVGDYFFFLNKIKKASEKDGTDGEWEKGKKTKGTTR